MTLPTLDPISLLAIVSACCPEGKPVLEPDLRAVMPEIRATLDLSRKLYAGAGMQRSVAREAA